MKKNESGVTLITLVITIVVLLILATVAVSSGKESIESTKLTTFTAEMKIMQSEVNVLYDKYKNNGTIAIGEITYIGKGDETNNIKGIQDIGNDIGENTNYKESLASSGISNEDYAKYKVYDPNILKGLGIDGIDQTFLVSVENRKVVSAKGLKSNGETYYTIEQLPDNLYNVNYTSNTSKPTIGDMKIKYVGDNKWRVILSDIQYGGYIEKWNVKYQIDGQTTWYTAEDTTFIVQKEGKYNIKVFNDNIESDIQSITINHSEVNVNTIEKSSDYGENIVEVREGNVPIPVGFKYVKGDKTGGVVITDSESDNPDEGSQFVWIPVNDINDMAQCETAGGDCNLKLVDGKLKCTNSAHASTAESIVGKLYSTISGNNFGTENTTYNVNSGLREPALVTSFDQDESNKYYEKAGYNSSNEMLQGMKNEYIAMITSVVKYKGFYVGRYETSLDENKVAKSEEGVQSATADANSANTWYGLYKAENAYNKNSVKGQMIWGSQYDAMMIWMQKNGVYVIEKPTNLPSVTLQNAEINKTRITGGNNNKDKLNNVYDILGNSKEWTAEANSTTARVTRGGYCISSDSPSNRFSIGPDSPNSSASSRLTLYIK